MERLRGCASVGNRMHIYMQPYAHIHASMGNRMHIYMQPYAHIHASMGNRMHIYAHTSAAVLGQRPMFCTVACLSHLSVPNCLPSWKGLSEANCQNQIVSNTHTHSRPCFLACGAAHPHTAYAPMI